MDDKTCQLCAHSREFKITLKDTLLECREGPPLIAYAVQADARTGAPKGVTPLSIVPRIVPDGYSCDRFVARDSLQR